LRSKAPLVIAAALAIFALADGLAFRTGAYRGLLDPASSTGSFERTVDAFRTLSSDPRRDVLVLGDSRIYSGLDPAIAGRASGGLRFLDGAVPGTTPRCWPFFVRAIDPHAARFRAVVIPVDTYTDDDSAIGSIDGDNRPMDLRYVVFHTRLTDIPKLAGSFSDPRLRFETAFDLLWRAPVLRDDVQELLGDPAARVRALAQAGEADTVAPLAGHPRSESLAGLRVDFARGTIQFPPGVSSDERAAIALQVLHVPRASPSYARYRLRWLAPIAARYAAAGVPVIFVRIPTRPVHRSASPGASGSLPVIARAYGARLLPAAPYLALERPELFADHDHLNRAGSQRFSALLGADVARLLANRSVPVRAGLIPPIAPDRVSLRGLIGIGTPLEFWSYEFLLFLAVVAALFYSMPLRAGRIVLLLASYYFYARWNGWYLVFLLILTLSDFAIAIALENARNAGRSARALLGLGVAANLAFLGTFKYANFASGTVAALAGMHQNPWFVSLFVPIGISFHTFQSISYLVDVTRGRTRAVRNLFDYALYLAFFAQLLAGPIVRAGLFFGELFNWRAPSAGDVTYGLTRIAFGLVKKLAIADQFAAVSNSYFGAISAHPGAPAAWSALFAFSMQIYFDFSGYSDIAIGCARLFGFVFPENFRQPYLATSVTDFWHRWHITLSTWLRDYLYIPLGGNRYGTLETLRNLMITMLLGGLWHGAQWTFVAWGGYHGLALCFERLTGTARRSAAPPSGVATAARAALTFTVVTLGWVLFRAPTFAAALAVYRALFAGGAGPALLAGWPAVLAAGTVAFGILWLVLERRGFAPAWPRLAPLAQAGSLAGLLLALALLSWPGLAPTFIYFKF
jgi:alginate O-acetyltransferase complex protein AlgI